MGSFVWLLYSVIGSYPKPLTKSENPEREVREVLLLWSIAAIVSMVRMDILDPYLEQVFTDRTLRELVKIPLLSVPYVALPLFIVLKQNKWTLKDLGLTWRSQSSGVAMFAVLFGFVSGLTAFLTNKTVMGIDLLPVGALILLLYNNSFLEEFYHRGVIQSKLEKAVGQKKAIFWGGVLFGLTHLFFDISQLLTSEGIPSVLFALLLQVIGGWLLGIVYMKTRSLWPGIACHYLVNWLPGILSGLTR